MAARAKLLAGATSELGSAAEARTLLAHVAGVEVSRLALVDDFEQQAAIDYAALVARRKAGEPLQYLTGRAYFRTIEVAVEPGVFIPRPETEVMTGWALDRLRTLPGEPAVVELCAGSGAISAAIAAERPGCRQYAVELSETAARSAGRNLSGTGVDLRVGDMADAFTELNGTVDLVIANPPYIPLTAWEYVAADVRTHEPDLALFSGDDGLDALRVVARVAARLLRPGGFVCAEHAEVQADSVLEVFAQAGAFRQLRDHLDLTGRPRFVAGVRGDLLAG
ncbi:MAG TPA: peptide chain release factor N(5)-glutamine methyltransferase [Propionicimonas sp.]|nr:peptide chain release factor N(5)-glutamine methyltransferase [Propionicimonas sp.]HRA05514.1 peptide chain release factor N(5)-glutamine methyltransferase [Propionicimonas sp.]